MTAGAPVRVDGAPAIEEIELEAGTLRVRALAAGGPDRPLVVLLHGFPELALSWRHVLPGLAAAGYRVVAPNLRGYDGTRTAATGDRRGPYDLATLVDDLAALVHALGRDRAVVVGHDWGGAVAWAAAVLRPELLERLVVVNCPHPAAFADEVRRRPRQLLRSAYALAFQLPRLPEWALTRRDGALVAALLRAGALDPTVWSDAATQPYRAALCEPGAAAAALGYYRAFARTALGFRRLARRRLVDRPTLVIWGRHDPALDRSLLDPPVLARWFAPGVEPTVRVVGESGHGVPTEAPGRLLDELLAWLPPPSTTTRG